MVELRVRRLRQKLEAGAAADQAEPHAEEREADDRARARRRVWRRPAGHDCGRARRRTRGPGLGRKRVELADELVHALAGGGVVRSELEVELVVGACVLRIAELPIGLADVEQK